MSRWSTLRILVVDDHDDFRRGLEALLGATDDVEVVGAARNGGDGGARWPSTCSPTWC